MLWRCHRRCYFIPRPPPHGECREFQEEQGPVPASVTPWSLAEADTGKRIGSYSTAVRLWTMQEMLLANTIRILKLIKHSDILHIFIECLL